MVDRRLAGFEQHVHDPFVIHTGVHCLAPRTQMVFLPGFGVIKGPKPVATLEEAHGAVLERGVGERHPDIDNLVSIQRVGVGILMPADLRGVVRVLNK